MEKEDKAIHYDDQAKKTKEEVLNDVLEWLGDNLYNYVKINRDFNEADYDSRLFDDLRKAMEE